MWRRSKALHTSLAVLSHLGIYAAMFAVDRLHMTTVGNSAFVIITGLAGTFVFSALSRKAEGFVAVYSQLRRSIEVFDGVTVRLPNRLNSPVSAWISRRSVCNVQNIRHRLEQ